MPAIAALGTVAGSIFKGNAVSDAANKQSEAAAQSNALQKSMYDQSRSDNEPYRAAGAGALSQMGDPSFQQSFQASDFQKDPGYDFRMQQGQQALERSAAARGGLNSGGAMRALSRFGQDYASNEYGKAYDRFNTDKNLRFGRLSSLAGMGQGANAQNQAGGQNYANQWGSNTMGAANAQGAAGIANANNTADTINSVVKTGEDAASMAMGGFGGAPGMGGGSGSLGSGGQWGKLSGLGRG